MNTNKIAPSLALALVVVFVIIGLFNITPEDGALWYIIDTYNIIILVIFADIFYSQEIKIANRLAMSALLMICAIFIVVATIIGSHDFWIFLDILTMSVATLSVIKILTAKN